MTKANHFVHRATRLLSLTAISALVVGTVACTSGGAGSKDDSCNGQTLKVAKSNPTSMLYIAETLAQRKGFFDEQRIKVEVVSMSGGSEAIQALVGKSVDAITTSFSQILTAHDQGAPVTAFASVSNRNTADIVMKSGKVSPGASQRELVEGLRGLRIGVTTPNSATDQTVRFLMRKEGLDPDKDAKILALGGGRELAAAYSNGAVDAVVIGAPDSIMAVKQGGGSVVASLPKGEVPDGADISYLAVATSKTQLKEKKALFTCYSKALQSAQNLIKTDPDQAKTLLRPAYEYLADDVFEQSWSEMVGSVSPAPEFPQAEVDKAAGYFKIVTGKDPKDLNGAYTNDIARTAKG